MAAFVSFIQTFAVWIYLLLIFGILLGIKMLVDAQRLSRATLFSLDHERASEQTYRGILVISIFLVLMFFVTGILLFIGPFTPQPGPVIGRTPTVLTPQIFPTTVPTAAPTATLVPTIALPPSPIPPTTITTRTPTRPAVIPPTLIPPSPSIVYIFPAPKISGPLPNGGVWTGEGQANAAITFRWECAQCILGPDDQFEVVISFVDKAGTPKVAAGRTRDTFFLLRRIYEGGGFELYQQAKDDVFTWFVQIKREPGNQVVSPRSETWKFIWH